MQTITDQLLAQLRAAYGHQNVQPQPRQEAWRDEIHRSHAPKPAVETERPVAPPVDPVEEIKPPRSWAQPQKDLFLELPQWAQEYIAKREKQRDDSLSLKRNQLTETQQRLGYRRLPRNCYFDFTDI